MQLLIYASPFNLTGRNLEKKIQPLNLADHIVCCASLKALDEYLRQPIGVPTIGILIPSDDGELAALIGMRHLLRDMRLILILPQNHTLDTTNTSAHMLRPRFIGYADGDLSDVTGVLCKMNSHIISTNSMTPTIPINATNLEL